ncbi:hypothetical protein ACLB2K_048848 [Fragaria x ananassa]
MAEKTHQAYPTAPSNGYARSDGESLVSEDELKRKKRIKLFAYIGIFIVFQIIVMTVFGLTVMQGRSQPSLSVSVSVSVSPYSQPRLTPKAPNPFILCRRSRRSLLPLAAAALAHSLPRSWPPADALPSPAVIPFGSSSIFTPQVKTPKARWGSIDVETLNSVPATPSLDTTFEAQLRIKNTNWGPYKFNAGTATFLYQGTAIGQVVIPKGKAGMRSTKKIDVEVSLNTNALPNSSALGTELSSGVLTLTSQVQLKGKVELMLIMKKNKNASIYGLHNSI